MRNVLNAILRARCSAHDGRVRISSARSRIAWRASRILPGNWGMVEFDDCALIELFPCAGRKGLMEATNSGKSVMEVNHKIPFLVD